MHVYQQKAHYFKLLETNGFLECIRLENDQQHFLFGNIRTRDLWVGRPMQHLLRRRERTNGRGINCCTMRLTGHVVNNVIK